MDEDNKFGSCLMSQKSEMTITSLSLSM